MIGDDGMRFEHAITISLNLGENFGIDYEGCSYKINGEEIKLTEDEYMGLLKDLYINKEYTEYKSRIRK